MDDLFPVFLYVVLRARYAGFSDVVAVYSDSVCCFPSLPFAALELVIAGATLEQNFTSLNPGHTGSVSQPGGRNPYGGQTTLS